jgi:hypothetical protein
VIQHFEGHIAQYLGDGLLIHFDYPEAHEDDAPRAVRTGLGIVEAMGRLNTRLQRERGIQLAVCLGTHTGLVVVGEIGGGAKHEQLALGETPILAARLQNLATPDTVVISGTTFRLVQGVFECQEFGPHILKGIAAPVLVYRIVGESGAQSRLEVAGPMGLTPLISRDKEVGLLLERWAQVTDGMGQVVVLSGEAGIGKSRLVQVLKAQIADGPHTRFEGRSSPPWQPDDPPEVKRRTLETALSASRLTLAEAMSLVAPLLGMPPPEEQYPPPTWSPQLQRQKTLEMLLAMVLAQAEHQPVLFVLEDLHWTDRSTLELVTLLIDHTPTASLLVLFTCRPEFQPPWSSRSYLTQMTLNRLSQRQVVQMMAFRLS